MPLFVGDKLGHYEVLSLLGQGGMGEVYRARDTKLKREVAIKVLPEVFARDPERMARFQREAEVLASLNHPNIATIHGVEDRALVMELVEGNSPKGPLQFDEVWKIASQIAAALEYAHERGIMHRDLKPANIMITPDGVVKLLDFGLAKAFSNQREPSASPENSPTLTLGATEVGVILGTAAYMAPEQARGKAVDKRADIWGFGVVLYELLTGERLFNGEDAAETLAAVIHKQPDLAKVPRQARRLLEECLQKDPKQRLRDIGDAKRLLGGEPNVPPPPAPGHRSWLPWCIAAFLLLALMPANILHVRETPPPERTLRYTIAAPENSALHSLAISPDGRYVAIAAAVNGKPRQLWLRPLDALQAQPMPSTDDAQYPFWSPDSRYIGFFAQGKLKKISVGGGPSQTLCEATFGRGASWSADDVIVFSPSGGFGGSIQRISAAGGVPVDITKTKHDYRYPLFLPDGRHFVYLVEDPGKSSGIYIGSLDGTERRLLSDRSGVAFAPPASGMRNGHLLYVRTPENTLMAQPFDAASGQNAGDVFPIAEGVSLLSSRYAPITVSENGVLMYSTGSGNENQMVWLDRAGKLLGPVGAAGGVAFPAISPDGKAVAFDRGSNIWLRDLVRGAETRFTLDRQGSNPIWSPKGDRIAFRSPGNGVDGLYQRPASGTGQEELLFASADNKIPHQWSRDGRFVVYTDLTAKTGRDIWVVPMNEGEQIPRKAVPFLQTEFNELQGQISPDGRWMAYTSDESAQREVYVRPFPTGDGKSKISITGGEQPRWLGDGRELSFVGNDGRLMLVAVKAPPGPRPTLEPGSPDPLFDLHLTGLGNTIAFQYDVTADGKRFLVNTTAASSGAQPLTVVVNWQAGLKK
jgi:serine/threonine protein kinase